MPRVRQYLSETLPQGVPGGRAASGADFAGVGPGMESLGESVQRSAGIIEDNLAREDVANVQVTMAKARADWTATLRDRMEKAQPGDMGFASNFSAELDSFLEKSRDSVTTKAGAEAYARMAASMRGEFVEKASGYQAALAGRKAVIDYNSMLDSNRNTLLNDPTQFGAIFKATTESLNDPNGPYARLPADERQKLEAQTKKALALSAVQGLVQNGAPELAKRQMQSGQWDQYLDADNKAALLHNADVAIKAKDTAAERERLLAERARRDEQEKVMNTFLARVIDPKANGGPLSDREILANPILTPQQKEHFIGYKMQRARELAAQAETRSNPGEVRRLMLEIHANPDDPRKTYNADNVLDAYARGRISANEMVFLRREVEQLRDGNTGGFQKDVQNARNAVYTTFSRSIIGSAQPERAADAAYRFTMDLNAAIERKRKANENPRDLLTPGHKEYMLSPERLATYGMTTGGAGGAPLRDQAAKVVGGPAVTGRLGGGPATPVSAPAPATLPSYKEFDKLPRGAQFTDPQGNVRVKP